MNFGRRERYVESQIRDIRADRLGQDAAAGRLRRNVLGDRQGVLSKGRRISRPTT